MEEAREQLRNYLKENNRRNTPERELILDEIYCKDGHFDVDALYMRLRKKYPDKKISKASVYRNMPLFVRSGLLRESLHDNARTVYEHVLGHTHHDHMKCVNCGKVLEFYDERIDKEQDAICRKNKFKMIWHEHVIYGKCSKCSGPSLRGTK